MAETTRTLNHSLSGSTSTPIRRRPSRGSLSAALLSASRSHAGDNAPPLTHLSSLFSEIADDIQDLTANFERLDALNDSLDTFNEAFASLLYGMKMNAFCEEFAEAPTKASFDYADKREAERKATAAASILRSPTPPPTSPTPSAGDGDATFQSHAEVSTRGGGIPRARGRGTTTAARGRAVAAKKKERRLAFAAELLQTLPIKYREEQVQRFDVIPLYIPFKGTQPHRGEMEQVISALREKPDGLYIPDIVQLTKVPNHRVNEACLALKRAKHVCLDALTRELAQGLQAITIARSGLLYQLDPGKYPPEAAL